MNSNFFLLTLSFVKLGCLPHHSYMHAHTKGTNIQYAMYIDGYRGCGFGLALGSEKYFTRWERVRVIL